MVDLLVRGFPIHGRRFWQRAIDRLAAHKAPSGRPRFGHLLECDASIVGTVLTIYSVRPDDNAAICCNLSSWFVDAKFRMFAPLLISAATRQKGVSFLNVSPAPHTLPIIEAQGFRRYSAGQFAALTAWVPPSTLRDVRLIDGRQRPTAPFDPAELELLREHASFGCITLWCEDPNRPLPFVFLPHWIKGVIPAVELIYSPSVEDYVRLAAPISRFLLKRGKLVVIIDSPAAVAGLHGVYFPRKRPKYYRGTFPPVSDLAYSEIPMFGL